MEKKKILLIGTGGTIASEMGENGLTPELNSEQLLQYIPDLSGTPVFEGDDLLARGVQMEAYSVEDEGDGVCFNVFVYNVQPGISIDYATGESYQESSPAADREKAQGDGGSGRKSEKAQEGSDPVSVEGQEEIRGNAKSGIYHCPGQASYDDMEDSPNLVVFQSEQQAIDAGYRKAKR